MNLLFRLRIGPRLMLSFAAVLMLTLIVGLFSIHRIGKVNEATNDVAQNWLVAIRSLGEYRAALNAVRRAEAGHAMAATTEEFDERERSIAAGQRQAAKAWKHYVGTVTADEERALVREIELAQQAYYAALARFILVSRAGVPQIDQAKLMFKSVTGPAFIGVMAALDKGVEHQTEGGDAAYKASQEAYAQARLAIGGLTLTALAVGAVLALLITRSITHPISRAVNLAERRWQLSRASRATPRRSILTASPPDLLRHTLP